MAYVKYFFVLISVLVGDVSSSDLTKDFLQSLKSCNVGDISQNECIKCICSPKAVYVCTPLNCNNHQKDKPEESKIFKAMQLPLKSQTCHPNMVYVKRSVTCICNKKGHWPHKDCAEIFHSLPPNATKHKCEPNTYVIVDCNVCRCSSNGYINRDRCTTNECEEKISISRRNQKSSQVYGNCESGNWYSLAPCQFCFCVNKNRLVCNTGHNDIKKLELGTYSLSVCGKQIIKEAIELVPDPKEIGALLRYGKVFHNETITSPVPRNLLTTEKQVRLELQNTNALTLKVNKDNIGDANEKDQADYYSESEEIQETTKNKIASRNGAITQMPFQAQDNKENDYDRNEETEDEAYSDNEITVEFLKGNSSVKQVATTPTSASKIVALLSERKEPVKRTPVVDPMKTLSRTLRMSLPMVIDKVFKMALRKSMVSLVTDSNCVPGTSSYIKCNMCFCMKNNKLLCTKNQC